MTNNEILQIAMEQSAADLNCEVDDFLQKEHKIVCSKKNASARVYLELPFYCDFTSYGNNIVASVAPEIKDVVADFVGKYQMEHCFETPNLHVLNKELEKREMQICFMAEYFLPDVSLLKEIPCGCEVEILYPSDFASLYQEKWSNALCKKRKERDVLAVAALDNGEIVGLAGCSADCDSMWQIGIDVLPNYRRLGIASALTSRLAVETLQRGKVPFYCAAWSNISSVRNAIKCGFRPAWVEMTAKRKAFVEELNQ